MVVQHHLYIRQTKQLISSYWTSGKNVLWQSSTLMISSEDKSQMLNINNKIPLWVRSKWLKYNSITLVMQPYTFSCFYNGFREISSSKDAVCVGQKKVVLDCAVFETRSAHFRKCAI